MNYSAPVKHEISAYLNDVKRNLRGMAEGEADEILLHLQEQMDTSLQELNVAPIGIEHVKRVISTMSSPASFAPPETKDAHVTRWGITALVAAVISWGFNLGVMPWFEFYGVVWVLFLTLSAVAALMSRKTILGKVAIGLLVLLALAFPVIHVAIQKPL